MNFLSLILCFVYSICICVGEIEAAFPAMKSQSAGNCLWKGWVLTQNKVFFNFFHPFSLTVKSFLEEHRRFVRLLLCVRERRSKERGKDGGKYALKTTTRTKKKYQICFLYRLFIFFFGVRKFLCVQGGWTHQIDVGQTRTHCVPYFFYTHFMSIIFFLGSKISLRSCRIMMPLQFFFF